MLNYLVHCLLIFCVLASGNLLEAQQADLPTSGTLIVTYSTGSKGERLERVRFRLTNREAIQKSYPQPSGFIDNEDHLRRMVVIEDLPAGEYQIDFVVPNTDGLFEPIPPKKIEIEAGERTFVDQKIQPRYGKLSAKSELRGGDAYGGKKPALSLYDRLGKLQTCSTAGKLLAHALTPGPYTIVFEEVENYITPPPQQVIVQAYHTTGPIVGTYHPTETLIKRPLPLPEEESIENLSTHSSEQTTNSDAYAAPLRALESFSFLQPDSTLEQKAIHPFEALSHLLPSAEPVIAQQQSDLKELGKSGSRLVIQSNMPSARWSLYRGNQLIYSGTGQMTVLSLPSGSGYHLKPEALRGHEVQVTPKGPITLNPGETESASVSYLPQFGSLTISGLAPTGEKIGIALKREKDQQIYTMELQAQQGTLYWKSGPLPVGDYVITFTTKGKFIPPPPERISIRHRQNTLVTPELLHPRNLVVTTNIPEAVIYLRSADGTNLWKGKGRYHVFEDLIPGEYHLSFTSSDPTFFFSPKEKKISVPKYKNAEVRVNYQIAGKIILNSNMNQARFTLTNREGRKNAKEEILTNYKKTLTLPEGSYRIQFHPLPAQENEDEDWIPPQPTDIMVRSFQVKNLSINYERAPKGETPAQVVIHSNLSQFSADIFSIVDGQKKLYGSFQGNPTLTTRLPEGVYEIIYSPQQNMTAPPPMQLNLKVGETREWEALFLSNPTMMPVAPGPSIVGNPFAGGNLNEKPARNVLIDGFSIGAFEVTNTQFAAWLNTAHQRKEITIQEDGVVVDLEGHPLFILHEKEPLSQIYSFPLDQAGMIFHPLPGKGNHPVVFVSWYGANAFAKSFGMRLPTEAEWEKAASVPPTAPGRQPHKYLYGFSRDSIDPRWANYKAIPQEANGKKIGTHEVGFYNGLNFLPLSADATQQIRTEKAVSPYQTYDMSGNVWEWVADWYDAHYFEEMPLQNPKGPSEGTLKVLKGGCYDSSEEAVRVTQRLGAPPEHMDGFTGFRLAK